MSDATANWAELLDEADSSAADSSFSSSTSPPKSLDSPPTSPDIKGDHSEPADDEQLEQPVSSGSARILRARAAPEKATLLSYFKPASSSSRPSFAASDSDSDSERPASQLKSKRKHQNELSRPSKRLALASSAPAATKDARPKLEQLFLDPYETSGHSTLSCAICNMSYARTPEDIALHDKHHKRVVGGCDWTATDGPAVTVLEDSLDWGASRGGKVLMVDATATGALGRKVRLRCCLLLFGRHAGADHLGALADHGRARNDRHGTLGDVALARPARGLQAVPVRNACAQGDRVRRRAAHRVRVPGPPAHRARPGLTHLPFAPAHPIRRALQRRLLLVRSPQSHLQAPPLTSWPLRTTLYPTLLGVQRIWTSATHRRHGLAARLLDAAAKRFIYGCAVDRATGVAFSQPTGAGMKLARQWTGTETFRVFVD